MIAAIQLDALAQLSPSYRAGSKAGARPKSDTSVAAGKHVDKTLYSRRTQVLVAIQIAGARGLTCRELAQQWGVGLHTLSGRFTELRNGGHIVDSKERRDGCAVWVVRA